MFLGSIQFGGSYCISMLVLLYLFSGTIFNYYSCGAILTLFLTLSFVTCVYIFRGEMKVIGYWTIQQLDEVNLGILGLPFLFWYWFCLQQKSYLAKALHQLEVI